MFLLLIGSPSAERIVVALGKFDALHLGHRALAERAASQLRGTPCLLSFRCALGALIMGGT